MNVQIDFDPFLLAVLAHALARAPKLNRKSQVFHSHGRDRVLLGFVLAF
jgi:hypothetical protein